MAYSLVTATSFPDLLDELELFLEAQGWTVTWNVGVQFGAHSGNCYAAIGVDENATNPVLVTDTYPDPDVSYYDYRVYGSLGKSFLGHGSHYWGLPGSPVTGSGSNGRVRLNDMGGPFTEVHFFGNESYVWVVLRTDSDRWQHFGFGNLDKKGMTHPDIGFMAGIRWNYWDDRQTANISGYPVKVKGTFDYFDSAGGNDLWFSQGRGNSQLYVPDGVLDPAFGVADDVINQDGMSNRVQLNILGKSHYGLGDYPNPRLMSHFPWIDNKPVTGGVPLMSFPVLFGEETNSSLLCFLGDMPGVRLCNIANVGIGEPILYGSEEYLAFPIKRRTPYSPASYDGKPSTRNLGVAFRKD